MRLLSLLAISAAAAFGQTAAPNATGMSIGHIHLIVNDPDAHKKLWVGVLGAQVTSAGSLEMLKLPGVFVIVQKARTAPTGGSDGSTVNHFGFLVKDLAGLKAKATAAGLTIVTDNPAGKQLMVDFPEKVRVEFTGDPSLSTAVAMHHIHLVTPDPEALRGWYVKTFGATAGQRGQFLAAMLPGGEVDFRKSTEAGAPTKGRSLDHIGFEVKNLEEFCKKLQADGVTFDMAYREIAQLGGLKLAFILDPVGTRIELTEGMAGK